MMKKVLKTIAAVTFAVLTAAVLPSCDKNSGDGPAEKPGTPGEEEKPSEQVCTFEITLENLEPTGVDMSVRPSIQGTTYYLRHSRERSVQPSDRFRTTDLLRRRGQAPYGGI